MSQSPFRKFAQFAYILLLSVLFVGCVSSPTPPSATSPIPNFDQVAPGIYRGSQPRTTADWQYLASIGVSNIIKLNEQDESSDRGAVALGMVLRYHPIDTIEQLVTGPNPTEIQSALREIVPGTYIHCEHGQDRTGLLVGLYRVRSCNWPPDQAWQEMLAHDYHQALSGLTHFWRTATNFTQGRACSPSAPSPFPGRACSPRAPSPFQGRACSPSAPSLAPRPPFHSPKLDVGCRMFDVGCSPFAPLSQLC